MADFTLIVYWHTGQLVLLSCLMKYSWLLVFAFCFQLSASTQEPILQFLKYTMATVSVRLAVETTCPGVMLPLAIATVVSSIYDDYHPGESLMPWALGTVTWFGSLYWRSKDPRFSF